MLRARNVPEYVHLRCSFVSIIILCRCLYSTGGFSFRFYALVNHGSDLMISLCTLLYVLVAKKAGVAGHSFIGTSSPATSPIFRLKPEGVLGSVPSSTYSETSHWTLVEPFGVVPMPCRVFCVRPSLLPSIISSNQSRSPSCPRRWLLFTTGWSSCVFVTGWRASLVLLVILEIVPISLGSISSGSKSRSCKARMSSPSRLPSVTLRKSASEGGSSLQ